MEKYEEAIKCFEKAIEIKPNFADAWNSSLYRTERSIEATFHIPEDVMRALKVKAVQDNKRFSTVAEDALRSQEANSPTRL